MQFEGQNENIRMSGESCYLQIDKNKFANILLLA